MAVNAKKEHPRIIQGGMGISISTPRLANAVAREGQLGIVSVVGIPSVQARRLQRGDTDVRDAFLQLPDKEFGRQVVNDCYLQERLPSYVDLLTLTKNNENQLCLNPDFERMTVASSYVEVKLAKQGHDGVVGINHLNKVEMPTLPSLFGAMAAGVDYCAIGAGFPIHIPGILDSLANKNETTMPATVMQRDGKTKSKKEYHFGFNPANYPEYTSDIHRPFFLPIISYFAFAKKMKDIADGFIIEGPTAGGHNAPPRDRKEGIVTYQDRPAEAHFGQKDYVDFEEFREFIQATSDPPKPYWIAGGQAGSLKEAIQTHGAQGIQVGSLFALCQESGLRSDLKQKVIEEIASGTLKVRTDAYGSPSTFPFKVVELEGTLGKQDVYDEWTARCALKYLSEIIEDSDQSISLRCSAGPKGTYLSKGGCEENTVGRICLCRSLMAAAGLSDDAAVVTLGQQQDDLRNAINRYGKEYTAKDALDYILHS